MGTACIPSRYPRSAGIELDEIGAEWELGVCDVGLELIIASHILLQQLGAHLGRTGSNGHSPNWESNKLNNGLNLF